jgi:hypothetical protein
MKNLLQSFQELDGTGIPVTETHMTVALVHDKVEKRWVDRQYVLVAVPWDILCDVSPNLVWKAGCHWKGPWETIDQE